MKRAWIGLILLLLALTACQPGAGALKVNDAWIRPATAGSTTGLFFTIDNGSSQADTLLSAACDAAGAVELHKTEMDGGVMKMIPQPSVAVPAGETVEFKPGSLHVMLIDLQRDLVDGEQVDVTLRFETAGEVAITATVTMK